MQKLPMHTKNQADENFKKLAALFPQAVTEVVSGYDEHNKPIIERAIDKDVLMAEIAAKVVDGNEQRYQFTWPDKAKTVHASNQPIYKTLRPVRSESVNFDDTENLYIEGDNLEVLKLLQESYLGKVKMIYIDPPYNTGNDFVYNDRFTMDGDDWDEVSGDYDEEGNRLFKNTDSNGRFHTDWLNMLYPRLKIARDLLSDDGVIFISIDDNEVHNLRKICDEVFGVVNFVAELVWERSYAPINMVKHFSKSHDYLIVYAKSITELQCNGLPRPDSTNAKYSNPDNDPRGLWRTDNLSVGPVIEDKVYEIITPSGRKCLPPKGRCWVYTREKYNEMVADNRIWFGVDGNNVPAPKRFLSEVKQGLTPMTIFKYAEVGHTQDSMRELRKLFDGEKIFDYSKPVKLIKQILHLYSRSSTNDIILDFFSGSATTAHAVMQLNAEDGGKRKFIMVQLPEATDEKSEAFKAGYKNICEIGKERIRRAGVKIKEEYLRNHPVSFAATPPQEGNIGANCNVTKNITIKNLLLHNIEIEEQKTNISNKKTTDNTDEQKIPLPRRGGSEADGVVSLKRTTQNYLSLPYNPKLKQKARDLRKVGNLSEVILWNKIKNKQFKSLDFDRQKVIGDYIVDFYCANHGVVIEIDGYSHDNKLEYDTTRNEYLTSLGLHVIHIADLDVKTKLNEVMEMLEQHEAFIPLSNKKTTDNTDEQKIPLPRRGGSEADGVVSLDIGFRVLKVDSTNMEHVYYTPKEYTQNLLINLEENIKKDRTPEDLLFQVMLELAVPLSSRIEELSIDNTKVFSVSSAGQRGYLMASFDSKIQESTVEHIAKQKPYYFVMRDSSIGTDSLSTNFEQIFATYSPDTQLKVL